MKTVYVYKLDSVPELGISEKFSKEEIVKWEPGLTKFIPPNSSLKYLIFWFKKYTPFLKAEELCAYVVYRKKKPVCSLVCVPAMSRWTFMGPEDLQIKNVYTFNKYRGKGLAYELIAYALQKENKNNRTFWYMTDDSNIASQKLCKKIGFQFVGVYASKRRKLIFRKGTIIDHKSQAQ